MRNSYWNCEERASRGCGHELYRGIGTEELMSKELTEQEKEAYGAFIRSLVEKYPDIKVENAEAEMERR